MLMTSTQGAETLYGTVVKPVFASVSAKAGGSPPPTSSSPETSASADTLRDRAAFATSE